MKQCSTEYLSITHLLANKKGIPMLQLEIQRVLVTHLPLVCAIALPIATICSCGIKKTILSTGLIFSLVLLLNSNIF